MTIEIARGIKIPGSITLDARTQRRRVRVTVDGKRITLPGSFQDECDAIGAAAHFWQGLSARRPKTLGLMTIGEWGAKYLDARETDGFHRAVDRDRSCWNAHIAKTVLAERYIDTATADDVREWLEALIKKSSARTKRRLQKQTIANALNLLRVTLEAAVEKKLIASNPARGVRLPKFATDRTGWDWLRDVELNELAILQGFTLEQRIIFVVAVCTGLRKGELWGLRWCDVDFHGAELTVCRSYAGPTKGGRVRHVPLIKPALEALQFWSNYGHPCDLVFPTSDVQMRSRNDSAGLVELIRKLVKRPIRFHDLRHTCASHLLAGTWAPKWMDRALRLEEVKDWLGHTKIATTERYAHLAEEALRGRVKRVSPVKSAASAKALAARGTPNLAIVRDGKAVLGHTGRALKSGRRVDAVDAAELSQVREVIGETVGAGVPLNGFANRPVSLVISNTCTHARPLSVRIVELLRQYAKRCRPADELVIDALRDAGELALAHERAVAEQGTGARAQG